MKKWFNFVNKSAGVFELYLYGAIVEAGWKWNDSDVTPVDFKNELDKTEGATELNIYINSPGGHISAGLAIYNMLKRNPANKTVRVDGISASIANVISMAANKIIMPKTSLMLAHKPLAGLVGMYNSDDLLRIAEELDVFEAPIVAAYVEKTGKTDKEIRKIMEKDAFMTAEDAVKEGFADEIGEEKPTKTTLDKGVLTVNGVDFDTNQYRNMPLDHWKPTTKALDMSVLEAQIKANRNILP